MKECVGDEWLEIRVEAKSQEAAVGCALIEACFRLSCLSTNGGSPAVWVQSAKMVKGVGMKFTK